MNYSINFTYNSIEELEAFMKDYNKFTLWKEKKKIKKEDGKDLRGSMTVVLHEYARQFRDEDPTRTYKECLTLAGNKIKQNKK